MPESSGRAVAAVQIKWQMARIFSRVDKDVSKKSVVLSFWQLFEWFPKSFLVRGQEMQEVRLRCFPSTEQLRSTKGRRQRFGWSSCWCCWWHECFRGAEGLCRQRRRVVCLWCSSWLRCETRVAAVLWIFLGRRRLQPHFLELLNCKRTKKDEKKVTKF